MRMRNKPWAKGELEACPYYLADPFPIREHLHSLFPKSQPVHLELGCGKGVFLASLAVEHPQINYLGIDIKSLVLASAIRNINAAYEKAHRPVDNVLLTPYDISRITNILSPADTVERIYINFCNPWDHPKQFKKRLTHPRQLAQYATFFPKGEIWFKTDDTMLFEHSLRYFEEAGYTLKAVERDLYHSPWLAQNHPTEHELRFVEQGLPIYFCIATKGQQG